MSRLVIAPIVEGHGEVAAVPILLRRIWTELLGGDYIDVLRPIRQRRMKIVLKDELERAVRLAVAKLAQCRTEDAQAILVLLDADPDSPCPLGPNLRDRAVSAAGPVRTGCVLANVEYETWFAASADSLGDFVELRTGESTPVNPEQHRIGKGWIQSRFRGTKYSETIDQPRLTAHMNLRTCRANSPSFDKLCREMETLLGRRA